MPLPPKLKISNYIDFGKSDELKAYVAGHFQNLDAADFATDKAQFLDNNDFGYSKQEKEQKLKRATLTANIYNGFGAIAGFASIFFSGSYLQIFFALLYPVLGILIMVFSKGLIKFISSKKKSVYPFVMLGFFVPPLILLFYSIDSFEIYNYENLWLPFLIITVVMAITLFKAGVNRSIDGVRGQFVMMIILSAIYGFASTRAINCKFDKSYPKKYQTTVVDEYTTTGKGNHYHIKLSPWHPGDAVREIDITKTEYQKNPIGAIVTVNLKKGLFNIPWFYVEL